MPAWLFLHWRTFLSVSEDFLVRCVEDVAIFGLVVDAAAFAFDMSPRHSNYPAPPHISLALYPSTVVREAQQGLPFTLSPEYLAAQRAYMRYHNMNPIFGISSRLVLVQGDLFF